MSCASRETQALHPFTLARETPKPAELSPKAADGLGFRVSGPRDTTLYHLAAQYSVLSYDMVECSRLAEYIKRTETIYGRI